MQQQQQQQSASSNSNNSTSAHLANVLQSQSAAVARAHAAAVSNMLMPTMPVHHSSMGQAFNMMQYAQAVLNMQQQQQSQQQAHRNQPAPPPPPPPPSQAHTAGSSSLDSLLRANGIHADHHRYPVTLTVPYRDDDLNLYLCYFRPPHGSSSTTVMNRSAYSTSQSPLTGVVPGSSPHSRSSTGKFH